LELHKFHFVANYGVSQRLLDGFLQQFHKLKVDRTLAGEKDVPQLTDSKLLPSSHSLSLLWDALVRLSYNWKWLSIEDLYKEFLRIVRKSHGLDDVSHDHSTYTLHRLPPVARFDATHFVHFLRAYGSRWRPERALIVISDMKDLGIKTSLRTWTLLARLYARGKRSDATRANRILDRAIAGMEGVSERRTRTGLQQEKAFANLQMFAQLLKTHILRRHRKEAWYVYNRLLLQGYRLGSDRVLDPLILQLFRLGRVRRNKRKPTRPGFVRKPVQLLLPPDSH
jgi:hypothetical protein